MARFQECIDALKGENSPQATLLRMRAMLCMGEHHAVVRADFLDAVDGLPQPERPVALALLSTAYFRCDMRLPAEHTLDCAYDVGTALGSSSVLAEIRYYDALQQWSQDNLSRASELITQFIDDERMKAKALELRAWIAAKAEDYVKHLIDMKAAFNATARDVWAQAAILHAIAVSARELYDEQAVAFLEFHADQVQWTEATRDKQCYVLRYLGWCAALDGRPLAAFQYFARAQHLNVSDPHQILIDLDRAYIAGWHGEDSTSKHYLQLAQIRAQQVDWKDASERRLALLLMAELIAKSDPGTATRILRRYCDIARPLSPILTFGSGDKRRRALEEYAAGVVYRANGMRDQAIGAFKSALAIWKPINYRWRAGLAALHLGDLTGRSFYADVARILIDESVPRAVFARVVEPHRKRLAHPLVASLSEGRRDVLWGFIAGLTNEEIAKRLNLTENLVKRRMSQIYRTFNAKSGREMWAILRGQGIV